MSDVDAPRCTVHYGDERCPNPTTGALPICGSCLAKLLAEPDPRRRRTLASMEHLPVGIVQQLVEDPDPHVRAQIASRSDLDAGTIARLADPDRETSPFVSRALASTPAGAEHAWSLCSTNDPMTLAILAFNPAIEADVLERLLDNPDPDVVQAARDAQAGNPPNPRIAAEIADARVAEARPISMAPVEAEAAAAAPILTLPPPVPLESGVRPEPRRAMWIILSAVAVAAVLIVAFLLIGHSSSDRTLTGAGPGLKDATTTVEATTTSTSTTTTTTTIAPVTTVPTTQAPVTQPPVTQAPIVTPPQNQMLTTTYPLVPAAGHLCYFVTVTVNPTPVPMHIVVTDDTGATLADWTATVDGEKRTLNIDHPVAKLIFTGNAVASTIYLGANATGGVCPS